MPLSPEPGEPGEPQGCPRPVRRAGTRWGWHHAGEEEGREEGQRRGSGSAAAAARGQRGSGCGGPPGWAERGYGEVLRGGMGQGCGRYGCDAADRGRDVGGSKDPVPHRALLQRLCLSG